MRLDRSSPQRSPISASRGSKALIATRRRVARGPDQMRRRQLSGQTGETYEVRIPPPRPPSRRARDIRLPLSRKTGI